jgi:hypothetical protein
MSDVTGVPVSGEVFLDARGDERTLRVSWHQQSGPGGPIVLSFWREGTCLASFRIKPHEVPFLIDALTRAADLFPSSARPHVPEQAGPSGDTSPDASLDVSSRPPNAGGGGSASA